MSTLPANVLEEFEKHAGRVKDASRNRKAAMEYRNLVEDDECREALNIIDTLGKRQPQDQYEGCVNLRTLRTLLKMVDERGWERSPHQIAFHSSFERCVSRVLYKTEWATSRPAIMAHNGWAKCSSEVLISTPRRFGKTFSIAIFCAALALTMGVEIVVFSPARRASRKLLERMVEFIRVLDCEDKIVEYNQEACRWLNEALLVNRGVVAAMPSSVDGPGKVVALDMNVASGHAEYWLANLVKMAASFNSDKTSQANNRTQYEAVTLHTGVPDFLPEGEAFGMPAAADTDAFIDAGLKVEVRTNPYGEGSEVVGVKSEERRIALCCTEIALMLSAAERGIAPAVIACCFAQRPDVATIAPVDPDVAPVSWSVYTTPKQQVDSHRRIKREPSGLHSLVTVSQLSTFTLDDLMTAIRSAPVQSRKEHLEGVLRSVCAPTFAQIKELSKVSNGYATVKLNMTPASIVFCPELRASAEGSWTLHGSGFMPLSHSYLDGEPRITDFNALFTTRVRAAAHSFEMAYVTGCLMMTAFTRAQHGGSVSSILWDHLLQEGDPSGFVGAVRAIQSRSTNTSAFLACIASSADMRELPEASRALSGVVSDLDLLVRGTIVADDGTLRTEDTPVFSRLVGLITGCSSPDTRIFARDGCDAAEADIETEHVIALEGVKALRLQRLQEAA